MIVATIAGCKSAVQVSHLRESILSQVTHPAVYRLLYKLESSPQRWVSTEGTSIKEAYPVEIRFEGPHICKVRIKGPNIYEVRITDPNI